VQASFTYGQYARGIDLAASEPYFLGTKVSAGIELFGRQNERHQLPVLCQHTYGATLQLGTPINEQLGVQGATRSITRHYAGTEQLRPDDIAADPAGGGRWSRLGFLCRHHRDLLYARHPRARPTGIKSQLSQDLAGLGGDRKFLRNRRGPALLQVHQQRSDGMVRAQGGYITGWGGQQVPLMNNFFGGPTMSAACAQRLWAARPDTWDHHG